MRRLVLSVLVALVAVLALYAAQPGWFSAPAIATHPEPKPQPTARPKPRPATRYPFLGEARSVDNVSITPIGVTYTGGTGVAMANRGYYYAIVTLRIVNHQAQDYTFVPNVNCQLGFNCKFYVLDSFKEKNPPVNYDPYHSQLRPVVLQSGGEQTGSFTFEVPLRDMHTHSLQLLYYHDPLGDANAVVHWLLRPAPHGR